MLTALDENGKRTTAILSHKGQVGFKCQRCKLPVILRKGTVKIPHFAHRPSIKCPFGRKESDEHLNAKAKVVEGLSKDQRLSVMPEMDYGDRIADVEIVTPKIKIAVEIQKSSISEIEVVERTKWYSDRDMYCIWLFLRRKPPEANYRYKPRSAESVIAKMHSGYVYYYHVGHHIDVMRFEPWYEMLDHVGWPLEGRAEYPGCTKRYFRDYVKPVPVKFHRLPYDFVGRNSGKFKFKAINIQNLKVLLPNEKP